MSRLAEGTVVGTDFRSPALRPSPTHITHINCLALMCMATFPDPHGSPRGANIKNGEKS